MSHFNPYSELHRFPIGKRVRWQHTDMHIRCGTIETHEYQTGVREERFGVRADDTGELIFIHPNAVGEESPMSGLTNDQIQRLREQIMHSCCACPQQMPPLPCCNPGHVEAIHGQAMQ